MDTETTRLAVCGVCGDQCFVDLTFKNGKILYTEKAEEHPNVQGALCLRGAALKQYLDHPDRIRFPLLRTGEKGSGEFKRISWEEAFSIIGERLKSVRETSGARACAFYSGHPKWYRYMLTELARDYGTPNLCTESSTCHNARTIAHELCYGWDTQPPNFLASCKTLLCWGANPAYAKLSILNGILGVAERGDNLIVIDPRQTPVTERATLHLRPWYGTDCALALGLAHVILAEGLEDKPFLEKNAYGFEEYRRLTEQYTPAHTERITGVPAEKIVQAGRMVGESTPVGIYTSSSGIAHSPNSVQAYRAIFLLKALTGSVDSPGGNGAANSNVTLNGVSHHTARPCVHMEEEFNQNRFPVWNTLIRNEVQAMGLGKVILSGDPYPIRSLIAFGMNFRMFPQSEQMRRALLSTEFYVDVDLFLTDSARCADLVLPCQADTEKEYIHKLQNNHLLYVPKMEGIGDCRNDIEIILGICEALDLHGPLTGMRCYDEYLNWMLLSTDVTLAELKRHPAGMEARPAGGSDAAVRGDRFPTPSGKVEFVSKVLEPYAGREGYSALPEFTDPAGYNPDPKKYPLTLCIGVKRPQFFHSRTYRLPWLANLEKHTVVNISPAQAERLGLQEGQLVRVTTPAAEQIHLLELDSGLQDGVAHLCHDDDGDQNGNDLISGDYFDPISGYPGFRCYFCRITPVEVEE